MSKVFFTADLHLSHTNIIKFCNRPFVSAEEMNNTIIERWNSKVSSEDTVFLLGDMLFGKKEDIKESLDLIYNLNGKIKLIPGNHDKITLYCASIISNDKLVVLPELYSYNHQDENAPSRWRLIVLCHYSMRVWDKSHFGSYHLYGHSHGTLTDLSDSLSMDVGMDTNNFYVYSYEDIVEIMNKKNYIPLRRDDNKVSYEETKKYYKERG